MLDVWIIIGFGFLGYVMRHFGFSVVAAAMGLILGKLVETNLKPSLVIFDGNGLLFFSRPIALLFFVLTALGLFSPMIYKKITSCRLKTSET
jgi:putative tricarboxylic transport membrane protein